VLLSCSHKGFLPKFVKRLKDMSFLREDLIFSTHSEEVLLASSYCLCLQMVFLFGQLSFPDNI